MRIIIPSFCLLFALQIQASCLPKILSWIPRLNHGGPVSETSSPVQRGTATENNKETSPATSSVVNTEPWIHTGYEPMNVENIRSGLLLRRRSLDRRSRAEVTPRGRERQDGSNQLHIEEATLSAAQGVVAPTGARIAQSSIPEQVTTTSHLKSQMLSEDVSDFTINRDEERGKIYGGSGPDMDSAVSLGCVTASHPGYVGYVGLLRAIDDGRLDIAVELGKQDEELGEDGVRNVIRKNASDSDLIANFINRTNQANVTTLNELWNRTSNETFAKVLKKVDFPQQALVDFAASSMVGYSPEKFLVLLNEIVKPEDQEKFVEKGVEGLILWGAETYPLLNALKGKAFRSERLEYLAIQKAFMEGVKRGIVYLFPNDICNHAAITPELYADGLIVAAGWGKYNDVRHLLLRQADRYDLQVVKENEGYADLNPEFRSAIEEALKTAAPEGTRRPKYLVRSAKIAKETFDEITGQEFSGITDITGSFLTGRPTTRERAKAVRQTIRDVTKTRTPEPTEEIDKILSAYVGQDEE